MATRTDFKLETEGTEVATAFPSSIHNKTIIITGVNRGGIGGATAKALATQSPSLLILTGRTQSKVQAVIDDLHSTHPSVPTRFLELDLFSQASVRQAAEEVLAYQDVQGIDLLLNNAGVMNVPTLHLSPEGIESQFATNHIGHFLFTNLIVPKLVSAASRPDAPPGSVRVVNVSSIGHMFGPVRFSDPHFKLPYDKLPGTEKFDMEMLQKLGIDTTGPQGDSSYVPVAAYAQSKTANILFSLSLTQKLLRKYGIASFALHPGSIATELQRNSGDVSKMDEIRRRFMASAGKLMPARKTLAQGCSTTLVAALDPGLKAPEALYLNDCQVAEPLKGWAEDADLAERRGASVKSW